MSSIEYLVVVPNLATRHFGLSAFSLSQTNGVVVGAELPLLLGVPLVPEEINRKIEQIANTNHDIS